MLSDTSTPARFDAHCHLTFAPDPERFAAWISGEMAGAFSTTVSPEDFLRACESFSAYPSIKVGLGAHPWWISQGKITEEDLEQLCSMIPQAHYIGEIGLDLGKNGLAHSVYPTEEATHKAQINALRKIFETCANSPIDGGRVFSFHAVRGADLIMDMLEEFELLSGNTAIFHWFSGSNPQLRRARQLGCFFSVNAFMMNTKRGREYTKQIPASQLLIETDLPEEEAAVADIGSALMHYQEKLAEAYQLVVDIKGADVLAALKSNVKRVFDQAI